MEIGGIDVLVETSLSLAEQERFVTDYLANKWPDLVIEKDDSLDRLEIFYYESMQSKHSWDCCGRTIANANRMIHFIPEEGCMTLVHEGCVDEDAFREAAEAMRSNI